MKQTIKDRITRISEELGLDYEDLRLIRKQAITLRTLYECACNGCTREKFKDESWDDYDQDRIKQLEWVEAQIEKRKATIRKKLEGTGIFHYFQTDPRGSSLYLSKEAISGNTYTRYGSFAIY